MKHTKNTSESLKKSSGALKFDAAKAPLSLVPDALLEGTARALGYGARKYGKNNYKLGMDHSRLLDAALRHIYAFSHKEDTDSESGLSHLDHAAASLGMLMYYLKHAKGRDDR